MATEPTAPPDWHAPPNAPSRGDASDIVPHKGRRFCCMAGDVLMRS